MVQLLGKLPVNNQLEWIKHSITIKPYATIYDFSLWLSDLARTISLIAIPSSKNISQSHPRNMYINQTTRTICAYCEDDHLLRNCEKFKELDVKSKWGVVKDKRVCFSCLGKWHSSRNCNNKQKCNVDGCKFHHNRLLHDKKYENRNLSSHKDDNCSKSTFKNCHAQVQKSSQLFKIVPVNLFGPNGMLNTFAMIDEGCAITLVEDKVAVQLGLKGRSQPLTLQWYGDQTSVEPSDIVSLEISEENGFTPFRIKNARTIKSLQLPRQSLCKDKFEHLRDLPVKDYIRAKPTILIGLDNLHLGIAIKTVKGTNSQPVAVLTKLGWIAYGPICRSLSQDSFALHIIPKNDVEDLNNIVAEYLAAENFGINHLPMLESEDDKHARRILEETTKRRQTYFETGLLWKCDNVQLPNNYDMAVRRLNGIENKMKMDPNYGAKYRTEINKYIDKGYARKLTIEEINNIKGLIWYLPHFAVKTIHKPDKMRIVFDATAVYQGYSLNSVLCKGPEQAKPLLNILFKFREKEIGVAADIKEMFSQVKIRQEDIHVQRFLWRNGNTDKPIEQFVMQSMIFGAICSTCCAEYIKNVNALDYKDEMPEAVDAIIKSHYVDDLVISFSNAEEAYKICQQIKLIHMKAGFELRNFVSNNNCLQNKLNSENPENVMMSMEKQNTSEKILGMYWNTNSDCFEFGTKFHRIANDVINKVRMPTKRELLAIVMSIFDPFGLIADFHIFIKILMQETWSHGIEWDETIPQILHHTWLKWLSELLNINKFNIPRRLSSLWNNTFGSNSELHIVVDASEEAMAAVGYLRVESKGQIDVKFVMGKTRLAPKKLMSIPRLELQAAILSVRLSKIILSSLDTIPFVTFWSDSKTVLNWIYSPTRKYKPFVNHRIAEILISTKSAQWRWIPRNQNSADSATRSTGNPKINNVSSWLKGPAFLRQDPDNWPDNEFESNEHDTDHEVIRKGIFICQLNNVCIEYHRFSKFKKLVRVMAWVLRCKRRWLEKLHKETNNDKMILTMQEINDAKYHIIKNVQQQAFKREIEALRNNLKISKDSKIYKLTPVLDDDGFLRVGGRIDRATWLPFSSRRPMLLPAEHYVTSLVLRGFHAELYHQNRNVIINECRQSFWIPKIKVLLKRIEKSCSHCIINKKEPITPLMGQLPLNIATGRRCEKRWLAVFTCLTTRAAHLEICENLSTDAFIISFRNFVNRRGVPLVMRSDNGTNFIGPQKLLNNTDSLFDIEKLVNFASSKNIEWIFNCPANPNAGGCWERLIRIIKNLLRTALKDITPRIATLQSILIEAENILNSRPLTEIPLSHEEDEPITPNHFLIGCTNSTQTPAADIKIICLKQQWRIAQSIKDRMWKRWVNEYLPQLMNRSKWHDKVTPVKLDDIVLIMDHTVSRNKWKRGRIIDINTAEDAQVRSATIKTTDGILRRPASKLIILNFGESMMNSPGGGV